MAPGKSAKQMSKDGPKTRKLSSLSSAGQAAYPAADASATSTGTLEELLNTVERMRCEKVSAKCVVRGWKVTYVVRAKSKEDAPSRGDVYLIDPNDNERIKSIAYLRAKLGNMVRPTESACAHASSLGSVPTAAPTSAAPTASLTSAASTTSAAPIDPIVSVTSATHAAPGAASTVPTADLHDCHSKVLDDDDVLLAADASVDGEPFEWSSESNRRPQRGCATSSGPTNTEPAAALAAAADSTVRTAAEARLSGPTQSKHTPSDFRGPSSNSSSAGMPIAASKAVLADAPSNSSPTGGSSTARAAGYQSSSTSCVVAAPVAALVCPGCNGKKKRHICGRGKQPNILSAASPKSSTTRASASASACMSEAPVTTVPPAEPPALTSASKATSSATQLLHENAASLLKSFRSKLSGPVVVIGDSIAEEVSKVVFAHEQRAACMRVFAWFIARCAVRCVVH